MITHTQLLQLRADVLEVVRGLSKPMPQHHIRDCLVGTASADHTIYALRMIDALVDTGELVRNIATDGGRNTYRAGTPAPSATLKRLRLLFGDDLDPGDAAAAPPENAAPPPHTLPPPSRPAPAGPPSVPNVTRINRDAKPEPYRPTDPLRARVLGLFDEAVQCTRAYLVSRLHDVPPNNVDNHLWTLCKLGLLRKTGPGEYQRAAGSTPASSGTSVNPKARVPAAKAALPKKRAERPAPAVAPTPEDDDGAHLGGDWEPEAAPVFAGPIITLDGAITDSPARDLPLPVAADMLRVIGAIQTLGATLRHQANQTPARTPIADLDTKVSVLRKLSPMVAADISAVLEAVASDLTAVAA